MKRLPGLLRHFSSAARNLLVLHPANQSAYSLQEALRLGESYAGMQLAAACCRRQPPPATAACSSALLALLPSLLLSCRPVSMVSCTSPLSFLPPYTLSSSAVLILTSAAGTPPAYLAIGSASRLRPSPATFFGKGQVELAAARVEALQPERIFVNHILNGAWDVAHAWWRSGSAAPRCPLAPAASLAPPLLDFAAVAGVQQRNLERAFGRPVLDRVGLIIEIFSQRARTNEVGGAGALCSVGVVGEPIALCVLAVAVVGALAGSAAPR